MKAAFFCAPGKLSMSLLMKCGETWGWKESFKIKFPLQLGLWVHFFLNCFWEEHSGAEPGFLWNTSKWLWIPIYNLLCLTCVISGVQSLWGPKNKLRDFQNANKRAKYNTLPMVRCVIATSHLFICGSSESRLSWQGPGETTQQPRLGPKGKKQHFVHQKGMCLSFRSRFHLTPHKH